MIRRLPVLQNAAPEDEAAANRPRRHWIAIGAGLILCIWLPVSAVVTPLGARLASRLFDVRADPELAGVARGKSGAEDAWIVALMAGPPAVTFALSCVAGGMLVGRFGGDAGGREAVLAGLGAGMIAWLLALLGGSLSPWPVALGALVALGLSGAVLGGIGGRMGKRLRKPR